MSKVNVFIEFHSTLKSIWQHLSIFPISQCAMCMENIYAVRTQYVWCTILDTRLNCFDGSMNIIAGGDQLPLSHSEVLHCYLVHSFVIRNLFTGVTGKRTTLVTIMIAAFIWILAIICAIPALIGSNVKVCMYVGACVRACVCVPMIWQTYLCMSLDGFKFQ